MARPQRLLLLADTHVPTRARGLPAVVWDEIDRADVVVHAGDWVGPEFFDDLVARVHRLVAVHGNNDGPALHAALPEIAYAEIAGLRLAVIHDSGPAAGRERRIDERFPGTGVVVFGHSHIPWDSVTPGGIRLLNPGSPTDRRRQPTATYLTATACHGGLATVAVHRLPPVTGAG